MSSDTTDLIQDPPCDVQCNGEQQLAQEFVQTDVVQVQEEEGRQQVEHVVENESNVPNPIGMVSDEVAAVAEASQETQLFSNEIGEAETVTDSNEIPIPVQPVNLEGTDLGCESTEEPSEPITQISPSDVLCGRGAGTNKHIGNIKFRQLVQANQQNYINAKVVDKVFIAGSIVDTVQKAGGRFLKKVNGSEEWMEISKHQAREKTSQALREKPDRKGKNGENVPSNVTELMQSLPEMPPLQEKEVNVSEVVTNLTSAVQAMSQVAVKLESAMQAATMAYSPAYIPQTPTPIAPAPVPPKPVRSTSRTMASVHLAPNAVPIQKHQITDNDVLFGRGGVTNNHVGNRRYRELVRAHQQAYLIAPKTEKAQIARKIVDIIRHHRDPPGRFLVKGEINGTWVDVGDERSREKTSQALREKAPEMRRVLTAAAGLVGVNKVVMNKGEKQADPLNQPVMYVPQPNQVIYQQNMQIPQQQYYMNIPQQQPIQTMPQQPPPMPQPTIQQPHPQQPHPQPAPQQVQQQQAHPLPPQQMYYPPPQQPQTAQRQYQHTTVATPKDTSIQITQNDVLYGRGAGINCHIGNQRFRQLVKYHQKSYLEAPKLLKGDIARTIVNNIRNATPPGRFLIQDTGGKWMEVDDNKACEKTSQALREKAPEIRKGLKSPTTPQANQSPSIDLPQHHVPQPVHEQQPPQQQPVHAQQPPQQQHVHVQQPPQQQHVHVQQPPQQQHVHVQQPPQQQHVHVQQPPQQPIHIQPPQQPVQEQEKRNAQDSAMNESNKRIKTEQYTVPIPLANPLDVSNPLESVSNEI